MMTFNVTLEKTDENPRTASYEGRNTEGVFVAVNFDRKKNDIFPATINVQICDLTKAQGA